MFQIKVYNDLSCMVIRRVNDGYIIEREDTYSATPKQTPILKLKTPEDVAALFPSGSYDSASVISSKSFDIRRVHKDKFPKIDFVALLRALDNAEWWVQVVKNIL